MQAAILILVVAICAVLAASQVARDAAEKGSRLRGVVLAGVVGFFAWGVLTQGFANEWPAAVGWLAFVVGAVQALTAKPV